MDSQQVFTFGQQGLILLLTVSAPLLLTVLAVGLLPTLANSAREVYLFAAGRENDVARLSAIALAIQAALALLLVPSLGAPGAAAALLVGELYVMRPLRRALEE